MELTCPFRKITNIYIQFYNNNIAAYLSELTNTNIKSLQDIVDYNNAIVGTEGGLPGIHPAFCSGQDGFIASLNTSGVMDDTYYQALAVCRRTTCEDGIDAALNYFNNGTKLDALLVPLDVG